MSSAEAVLQNFVPWQSRNLERNFADDRVPMKKDFEDYSARPRPTNRGRVAEMYKRMIAVDRVKDGDAHSTCYAIKQGKSGIFHTSGTAWEESVLLSHHAAVHATIANSLLGHIRVAEDGSRHGTPGEETQIYFSWLGEQNLSTVWPPQVLLFFQLGLRL